MTNTTSDARAITCPKCNAAPGQICKRADGHVYRRNGRVARHIERVQAWNAAGRPAITAPAH